jgi:chemotaxis protein CheD
MEDFESGLQEIFVHPGEVRVANTPAILRTVLGSCVGIVFWIPRLMFGALCHPMLPTISSYRQRERAPRSTRYVDAAIECMIEKIDSLHVDRGEVQVKLFGGADVLHIDYRANAPTVGQMNRETAVDILRKKGFRIVASSLGGDCGVQILFHTGTGEVRLRRLA